jgi:hypothetical protein
MTDKHEKHDKHDDKHAEAKTTKGPALPDAPKDEREPIDPKTGLRGKAESPGERGQLTRDNVNPHIPSGKPGDPPGPIVDPKSLGMESTAGTAAPKAEAPQAFPFTGSINEPQTVSLPLPQGTEVPKPAISGLDPAECAIGDADFTLSVSGDNFFKDSVINFAGHDEPTTFADGVLSTGVKPSLWSDPVTVEVIIKNGPESSAPASFEFTAPAARSKRK